MTKHRITVFGTGDMGGAIIQALTERTQHIIAVRNRAREALQQLLSSIGWEFGKTARPISNIAISCSLWCRRRRSSLLSLFSESTAASWFLFPSPALRVATDR